MHNRLLEIISVGNELPTGRTLNTNAQWMSKKVSETSSRSNEGECKEGWRKSKNNLENGMGAVGLMRTV